MDAVCTVTLQERIHAGVPGGVANATTLQAWGLQLGDSESRCPTHRSSVFAG